MEQVYKQKFPFQNRFLVPVWWLFLTVLLFLFCWFKGNTDFLYDASYYWSWGSSFWNPSFSFNNYPECIRGYLLSFILGLGARFSSAVFGNPYYIYWLTYSICIVLLIAYLLPALLHVDFFSWRYVLGTFVCTLLVLYFWGDLLINPLSDIPGLTAYMGVVLLVCRIFSSAKLSLSTSLMGVGAGLLSYAAYNIRTVYLYPLLLLWLVFFIYSIYKKHWFNVVIIILAVIGAILIAIPQSIINMNHYNTYLPFISTPYAGKSNLFLAQLVLGISYPRYETYVGDNSLFPSASAYFVNDIGSALAAEQEISSISSFVVWAFTHFLDACALYWEHLVSCITIFWRKAYITEIGIDTGAYLLNCAIYILALVSAIASGAGKKFRLAYIYAFLPFGIILLPAFMALFGAVEIRFFFVVYLLVYGVLAFKVDYKTVLSYVRTNKLFVAVLILVVFFTWNTMASHLLAEVDPGTLTLSGAYYN